MTGVRTETSVSRMLARAAAAEWTRLRTVSGTWWCLAATAVIVIGVGIMLGVDVRTELASDVPGADWPPLHQAGELALLPGQFGLLLLVLLAITSEYTTGQITASLQWTPRRGVLLTARTLVTVLSAILAGVVLVAAADLVAWAVAPPVLEVTAGGLAGSLVRVAGVLALSALLASGIGFLLRSTAGALAAVFLLMLVLPVLLPNFGIDWLRTVADHLPGGAAMALLSKDAAGDVTGGGAWLVLATWAVAAAALGAASLLRRDAD